METFQILSDQFNHFQHLFHRWLAIFFIISSYIFDLSSSPHTWGIRGRILSIVFLPVHPHLCWAYPSLHLAAISQNGSSPHTWGIRLWQAGCIGHGGSSPHTWGIQVAPRPFVVGSRFIPTYVGHTEPIPPNLGGAPVHPHIRGAYIAFRLLLGPKHGSSPHTWGILPPPHPPGKTCGFIPTYVGHTPRSRSPSPSIPVHPHIRGAYVLAEYISTV